MWAQLSMLRLSIVLIFFRRAVLTRYLPKAKIRKEKNLLKGNEDDVDEKEEEVRKWGGILDSSAQFIIP